MVCKYCGCEISDNANFCESCGASTIETANTSGNSKMGRRGKTLIIGIIAAIVVIVIAAVSLVINILGMRKIHRLAKSTYQSVMFGTLNLENPRGAKNWLIFFGVCSVSMNSKICVW